MHEWARGSEINTGLRPRIAYPLDKFAQRRQVAGMQPRLPGLSTIAMLTLSAILVAWLGISGPVDLERVVRWQPLIAGVITGLGVLVAAWNVTRQMRLAAAGRELDRIDKEIPGIRATLTFSARFVILLRKKLDTKRIITEFQSINAMEVAAPDFPAIVENAIPTAPDFIRREFIIELYQLRRATYRLSESEAAHFNAHRKQRQALAAKRDSSAADEELAKAADGRARAERELSDVVSQYLAYHSGLVRKAEAESIRADKLRRVYDRYLDL